MLSSRVFHVHVNIVSPPLARVSADTMMVSKIPRPSGVVKLTPSNSVIANDPRSNCALAINSDLPPTF